MGNSGGVRVLGADVASRHGWVGIVLDGDGYVDAVVGLDLAALIAAAGPVEVVAVDIPIGNIEWGGRAVDGAARALLAGRASTIFTAPPDEVLEMPGYETVNQTLTDAGRPKLSKQSWALRHKMLDAAQVVAIDDRIHEVSPELSFAAMNDGEPLSQRKKSWGGAARRLDLLAEHGVVVPFDIGAAGEVPVDDILDAAACAWTARRIVDGTAITIPDPDTVLEVDKNGRPIQIRV